MTPKFKGGELNSYDRNAVPNNSGSGSGSGYGYGSGSSITPQQQKAADNLAGIAKYNADTIKKKTDQGIDALKIADDSNKAMHDITTIQNQQAVGNDLYRQIQNLQSVNSHLRDSSGNAMYSSSLYDLDDMLAKKLDQYTVDTLDAARKNQNAIDNDLWESTAANNNTRNELYSDAENNLREISADYAAQLNNINPDLANGVIDAVGLTINSPDWLDTSYYDANKVGAIEPTTQGLYRPDQSAIDANRKNLMSRDTTSGSARSGNQDYWTRARQGYNRRTQ